jgi:hypothetical protein
MHPKSTEMYQDLKEKYWWYGLKRDVATYVALCDVCQRVKAEHQRPLGLLQPLRADLVTRGSREDWRGLRGK